MWLGKPRRSRRVSHSPALAATSWRADIIAAYQTLGGNDEVLVVIVEGRNRTARLMGEGVLDVAAICEIWN